MRVPFPVLDIPISYALLSSASLADLFRAYGGEVNPKLTKLVGQIVQSRMEAWQEAAYKYVTMS